ncbi:MAG: SufS family cysteine desulfurase [Fibromonadaceae bacterium]|jgi:cysteine desulfurase/selenocysteine lyase|nr:SufS family cysteine desulfurase [Fibromonadaceae bacterium]
MQTRPQFPVLSQSINGHSLAFLDSAATTQKPLCVIKTMNDFYKNHYSSVKRGAYSLSAKTTQKFEKARAKIAKFIDVPGDENSIVFTKGTTESINLAAWSYGLANFEPEDEILLSVLEHHANIVPWQLAGKERGAKLRVIPCDGNGDLQISELPGLLSKKTKIVSLAHTANSIGAIHPLAEIIPVIRKLAPDAKILIDAAQGAPHSKISVKNLDCDFLAFSGHKIYGPTGVGVLYGKPEILANMPPWQGGGEMIDKVSFDGTTFAVPPARFEAGTPPIAEVLGLGAAIDWVNDIGIEKIALHERQITEYALPELQKIEGLQIVGEPKNRSSIISFVLRNIHPHDAALILDEEGIAVRAGHHCAQPAMEHFGIPATLRASFAAYTEEWEIDRLCQALKRVAKIFSA